MKDESRFSSAQTIDDEIRQRVQNSELRNDVLRRERDKWRTKYRNLLHDYEMLMRNESEMDSIKKESVKVIPIDPKNRSSDGEGALVLAFGDIHPFETVVPREVNGLNEYNPVIADKRLRNLWRGAQSWYNILKGGQNIKHIIMACLGDIHGGYLREEDVETNAGTPNEETLWILDRLISGCKFMLDNTDVQIDFIGIHGNHDRDTDKKHARNMARHARSWVVYKLMERYFTEWFPQKRINIRIAEGYHYYLPIYDRVIRFHHGDAFHYNGGIGGPTVPVKRGIAQWEQGKTVMAPGLPEDLQQTGHADYDVFGHLHHTFGDSNFAGVPSLIGYNSFAIQNKFPFEPPAGRLISIDKKRWINGDLKIFV